MLKSLVVILKQLFELIKRHKVLLTILIVLPTLLFMLTNYSLLKVEVSGVNENEELLLKSTLNDKTLRAGYNLVKKGQVQVSATTSTKETLATTKVELLKVGQLSLELKNQKSVDTFVYDTRGSTCAIGRTSAYECRYGNIYAQNPVQELQKTKVLPNVRLLGTQAPYKAGIISIAAVGAGNNPAVQLIFTDGREVKTIDSSSTRYATFRNKSIITSVDSDEFLVHDSKEKLLTIYKDVNDTTPVSYGYGGDYKGDAIPPDISLVKNGLFIYYTVTKDVVSEKQEDAESASDSFVVKYSRSSSTVSKQSTYNITQASKAGARIDEVRGVAVDLVVAKSADETLRLINISDEPVLQATIESVGEILQSGGNFYYRQGNKIYRLDLKSQTAYLLSEARNSSIKSLWMNNGLLLFTANSNNTPSVDSIYEVTSQDRRGIEPFSILPYSPQKLPIVSTRFSGNNIYISVDLKSLYRGSDLKPIYKESEYTKNKNIILDQLKKDGLDTSKYKVNFYPGPVVSNSIIFSEEFTGDGERP